MKFDVIIGNPPYQINTGGGKGQGAKPIYQLFIDNAIKINPTYISMIVPSRWMSGGRGLEQFRKKMLNDNRLEFIYDFEDSKSCFPSVDIKGGVNYFLWNKNKKNKKVNIINKSSGISREVNLNNFDIVIRDLEGHVIIEKVLEKSTNFLVSKVSPQTPFGLHSNFKDYTEKSFNGAIKFYGNKSNMKSTNGIGYISLGKIKQNKDLILKHKVYIAKSSGSGQDKKVISKPFYGEINSCCSQTYLIMSSFESKIECENLIKYACSKFFRFMVSLRKNTQDGMRDVYSYVPDLDMTKEWTDKELYQYFNLTEEEINYIENKISPME